MADTDTDKARGVIRESNKERIWRRIQQVVNKRGYKFDDHLSGQAYGEIIYQCVTNAAKNMHAAAGMSEPIIIEADYTDYRTSLTQSRDRIMRRPNQPTEITDNVVVHFGEDQIE